MLPFIGFWLLDIWEVYLIKLRKRLRQDLKDTSEPYRWTDEQLDRAISRAVSELSHLMPREMETELATTQGSREVDISSLTDLVKVFEVEYPVGTDPRTKVYFEVFGSKLHIGGSQIPTGDSCIVKWGKLHTLSETESTIPAILDDVILMGAQAFAVLARSQYVTEQQTPGGWDADRDYQTWGRYMLDQFYEAIQRQTQKRRIKSATLREETY